MNKTVIQVGLNQCDSPPRSFFLVNTVVVLEGEVGPTLHPPACPLCVSVFDPGVCPGVGHTGFPPRPSLGTVTDAERAAWRGPPGLVRAEPGNVHFAETF